MSKLLLTSLVLISVLTATAQEPRQDSVVKKTGWFIFSEQQVFWVETPLSKSVLHKDFFKDSVYSNGLRLGGSYKALYFSFLAKEFQNDYFKNMSVKSAEDSSLRCFWLLPVTAEVWYRPQLDLYEDEGEKLFLTGNKKVKVLHKWERNYTIGDFDFLRKEDSQKAAKHLAKLKVPPDEYYGQKGAW
jgi:hypothetical protein